jgi:hypothetical protein
MAFIINSRARFSPLGMNIAWSKEVITHGIMDSIMMGLTVAAHN